MGNIIQIHIGMAATVAEAEDFKPFAIDIDDCIARIMETNRRMSLLTNYWV